MYNLNVNIPNKSAKILLPYIEVDVEHDVLGDFIQSVSQVKDTKLEVSGNHVSVWIDFDFGKFIPDSIWGFGDGLLDGFPEKDYMIKEMVLEYVKKLMPAVMKEIRNSAISMIEEHERKQP